ncbi:maltose ABC transporter substrate-binding protein [Sulfoacidibacillus thermotolerans]|uniref:Maltodextrin-binding protein n=1 Tax=Sulfoacidibacillus thermotolerans TaxID=1765684 RepID=A0A2U3D761_SULT2|nr:maltose ABC transporter substrate-binding protein [Sulfoacidibacillus thermotolerans]PWI57101.1 maltose ABC transporter substrate-binding protein [Sulfoacidibacillus thermotolerans]
MNKKLKIVAYNVTALTMISGLLSGCGAATNSASSAPNPASPGIPSGQTITVWSWATGPQLQDMEKIADAWAKKHGDTVKVVDQSHNANGFQFYATAARTGKGPDIVFGMPHDNNGAFAQEGLLSKVPNGFLNNSDYANSVIDAVTINGVEYSVPVSVQTTALFYNKDEIPVAPTTWSQFENDANKYGFGYAQHNLYFNFALVGGMGGYVFKDNNGTLDPNDIGLANAGAVQAYTLMYDMDHKYHWMTPSENGNIAQTKFQNKSIGMFISGPWEIPNMNQSGVKYGIAPWPTLPNGHPATPFLGVITTFVSASSHTQSADWSLVKAITNANAQQMYFQNAQQIPALTSVQQSAAVQDNPYFKAFADQVKNAVPMPNIPQMQAVWTAMSVLSNIIDGKVSPEQGAQDFVANIKKGILIAG